MLFMDKCVAQVASADLGMGWGLVKGLESTTD